MCCQNSASRIHRSLPGALAFKYETERIQIPHRQGRLPPHRSQGSLGGDGGVPEDGSHQVYRSQQLLLQQTGATPFRGFNSPCCEPGRNASYLATEEADGVLQGERDHDLCLLSAGIQWNSMGVQQGHGM